jgi:hypothetical protein
MYISALDHVPIVFQARGVERDEMEIGRDTIAGSDFYKWTFCQPVADIVLIDPDFVQKLCLASRPPAPWNMENQMARDVESPALLQQQGDRIGTEKHIVSARGALCRPEKVSRAIEN